MSEILLADLPSGAPRNLTTAQKEYWHYRTQITEDNRPIDDPTVFKFHFPRGTLKPRMSGWEIAKYLMPHMASVLPFFSGNAQIYVEFQELLLRLATWGEAVLDEIVPWIRSVTRDEEDEIVHLELFSKTPLPAGPVYFLLGD